MSHFYGTISGSSKSPADRRGSRRSGVQATLATRRVRVTVDMGHSPETGADWLRVTRQLVAGGPTELMACYVLDVPPRAGVD